MGRVLEFEGVQGSFDGETLVPEINQVITPYSASVSVSDDGDVLTVEVPDGVPEDRDLDIGIVVAQHVNETLYKARNDIDAVNDDYRRLLILDRQIVRQMQKYRGSQVPTLDETRELVLLYGDTLSKVIRRLNEWHTTTI